MRSKKVSVAILIGLLLTTLRLAALEPVSLRAGATQEADPPAKHPKKATLTLVVADKEFANQGSLGVLIRYRQNLDFSIPSSGKVTVKVKRMTEDREIETLTTFKKVAVERSFAIACKTLPDAPLEEGDLLFVEWVFKKMPSVDYIDYDVEFFPGAFNIGCG